MWLEITNVDPEQAVELEATLTGLQAKIGCRRNSHVGEGGQRNTFEAPGTVAPKPVSAKIEGGKLTLHLAPKSITVISVQ